jgi:hypothetical protein
LTSSLASATLFEPGELTTCAPTASIAGHWTPSQEGSLGLYTLDDSCRSDFPFSIVKAISQLRETLFYRRLYNDPRPVSSPLSWKAGFTLRAPTSHGTSPHVTISPRLSIVRLSWGR